MAAVTKRWAVLHFLVAVTDSDNAPGDTDLQNHACDEVAAIVAAGKEFVDQMHVAVQLERWHPRPAGSDPRRRARRWKILSRDEVHIEDVPVHQESSGPQRADDLTDFFTWTRSPDGIGHSPAQHVAVFFWGHSAGPAGIFDLSLGTGRRPPAPLLSMRRFVLDTVGASKLGRFMPTVELPEFSNSSDALGRSCDILLFKDCWMSTAETICELDGRTGTVLGSQSQVPIAGVWNYLDLYRELTQLQGAEQPFPTDRFVALADLVADFYHPEALEIPHTVPYSLLEVSKASPMRLAIGRLASILRAVPLSQRDQACRDAFENASTGPLPDFPGDIALLDLKTLCDGLRRSPVAREAADALAAALAAVIRRNSFNGGRGKCSGLGIFYYPSPQRIEATPSERRAMNAPLEAMAIKRAVELQLYRQLSVNQTIPGKWSTIAFEQQT